MSMFLFPKYIYIPKSIIIAGTLFSIFLVPYTTEALSTEDSSEIIAPVSPVNPLDPSINVEPVSPQSDEIDFIPIQEQAKKIKKAKPYKKKEATSSSSKKKTDDNLQSTSKLNSIKKLKPYLFTSDHSASVLPPDNSGGVPPTGGAVSSTTGEILFHLSGTILYGRKNSLLNNNSLILRR